MLKKIDILGIEVDNYTVREAMMQVENYLDNTVMNTIETIDMKMLELAGRDETVRACIEQLDLAVIGEKEILIAADVHSSQRISETINHDFFREFIKRIIRNHKRVFLLAETIAQEEQLEHFLVGKYEQIEVAGHCAIEEKSNDFESVVNEINSASADVIFSILPSPLQEQFLTENKSKLDAKIWYGLSSDYAPHSRISRISQIAGRLIHKKKLQSKLHKYNKD